jgi:hypothetical protein
MGPLMPLLDPVLDKFKDRSTGSQVLLNAAPEISLLSKLLLKSNILRLLDEISNSVQSEVPEKLLPCIQSVVFEA